MIRVAVISDIRLYREGLTQALERADGLAGLGSAAGGMSAVNWVVSRQPDVAVLDMGMPDAVSVLQSIGEFAPAIKVVGIAVGESESEILASVEAGVAGYVLREHSLEDLVRVIHSVVRDEAICSPRTAASLMHRLAYLASERRHDGPARRLTVREREVASLLALGMTNKEIAHRLSIHLSTVKNHVHNILEKLQLHRRGQAVLLLCRWESPRSLDLSGGVPGTPLTSVSMGAGSTQELSCLP